MKHPLSFWYIQTRLFSHEAREEKETKLYQLWMELLYGVSFTNWQTGQVSPIRGIKWKQQSGNF